MDKTKMGPILEHLENRVLFSTSAEAAVQADELKLAADKTQFSTDRHNAKLLLAADRTQLNTDRKSLISSAVTQLQTDQSNEKQIILADKNAGSALITADHQAILADHKLIVADKNNSTAETADLAKLSTDQMTLTTDTANLKNTLAIDRANQAAIVKTDTASLNNFRQHGDATITADQQKVTADGKSTATILFNDSKTIAADEVQLAKDQLAEFESLF